MPKISPISLHAFLVDNNYLIIGITQIVHFAINPFIFQGTVIISDMIFVKKNQKQVTETSLNRFKVYKNQIFC